MRSFRQFGACFAELCQWREKSNIAERRFNSHEALHMNQYWKPYTSILNSEERKKRRQKKKLKFLRAQNKTNKTKNANTHCTTRSYYGHVINRWTEKHIYTLHHSPCFTRWRHTNCNRSQQFFHVSLVLLSILSCRFWAIFFSLTHTTPARTVIIMIKFTLIPSILFTRFVNFVVFEFVQC